MLKYSFLLCFMTFFYNAQGQALKLSYGFDFFYFPDFNTQLTQYSESYKIEAGINLSSKIKIIPSYRYAAITGNFPHVLDDYPNISNTEPNQEKYINYKEFKRGIYNLGEAGLHWSQFINLVGFDIGTNLFNIKDRFWIDCSIGTKLEFYKANNVRTVVGDETHGAIVTQPDGVEVILQFHTYEVISSVNYVVNASFIANQKTSKNTFLFLGTDFNYLLSGDAYWFVDFGIGYKF